MTFVAERPLVSVPAGELGSALVWPDYGQHPALCSFCREHVPEFGEDFCAFCAPGSFPMSVHGPWSDDEWVAEVSALIGA